MLYESEEVQRASQLFRVMAHGVIEETGTQKDEAINIGVAPQTINNWLVLFNYDMPAFALSRMRCGNIILEKLLAEWRERFGGKELKDATLAEIEMTMTENMGVINSIVRKEFTQAEKYEAVKRMQRLKEAVIKMEIELHKILEKR